MSDNSGNETAQAGGAPAVQASNAPRPRRFGRRAAVATAAVAVCAAGVALAPTAEHAAQQFGQQAVDQAYAAGVAAGRQALLAELAQLEGVPIDAAIKAAELTRLAVLYIVRPLANLFATITGDALGVLISAVESAQQHLASINVHITQLDQIHSLLVQWRTNVLNLPIEVTQYATADIDSAENYLKAVKKQIQQQTTGSK